MSLCPHCGKRVESTQAIYQQRRRAQGKCSGCGAVKAKADQRFWRCRACRLLGAIAARARYARKQKGIAI